MINQICGFIVAVFACYGIYTLADKLIPSRKKGEKNVR
jgi:hypothetical protein